MISAIALVRTGGGGENRMARNQPQDAAIPFDATISTSRDASAQPRARGSLRLSVKRGPRGSTLDGLRQQGALKVLFPRGAGPEVQGVMVNTAGGITGGDRFEIEAVAGVGTALTLTTQTAERVYRAQPGETGQLSTRLEVGAAARMNWLPQETILFDRSDLRRSLRVDLAAGARLLLAEPLVFGRAAMGERLSKARFHDRIEIWRDGVPLFIDAMTLDGDVAGHLSRANVADRAGAMVLLVYVAPDAEALLPILRELLPPTAGASLIGAEVLVARALASDSHVLRRTLIPILNRLSDDGLPRPWMI